MAWRRWIKLYIEILDDPKMGRMPDWLWRRTVELFLLAGENGNDGVLPPVEEIAWCLRIDEDKVRSALSALSQVGVAEQLPDGRWRIIHFSERQDPDSPAERGKEFRKRNSTDPIIGSPHGKRSNENRTYRSLDKRRIERDTDGDESRAEERPPRTGIDFGRSTFTPQLAEDVVRSVTGWVSIPASDRDQAIDAIQDIFVRFCHCDVAETIQYLTPFYTAARNRYPGTIRCFWLVDWAVTGKVPDAKKNGNGNGYKPPAEDLTQKAAAELIQRKREKARAEAAQKEGNP